ncbi:DUF7312 domain-containing protein [Salinigranum sp. GCM10025319]|uniref:DUF7312 domain-containing protein n=1 Tax=Salinigranum sp. GCM10025319 TaxID=3252687 RepID=UPI00361CB865
MAQSGPDSETDHDTGGAGDGPGDDDPAGFTTEADASDASEATDVAETTTEEEEWQFGLDEVGPDGIIEPEPEPLEPGTPTIENVIFVLVGVVGTLLLLWTVF